MLPCSARKITYQNPANPGRVATSRRPAARWLPPILRGHQKCETSDHGCTGSLTAALDVGASPLTLATHRPVRGRDTGRYHDAGIRPPLVDLHQTRVDQFHALEEPRDIGAGTQRLLRRNPLVV